MVRTRDDDRDGQAAGLMLTGLLFLFVFVVLFIFIGVNADSMHPDSMMQARSDASGAQVRGGETTGSAGSN